MLPRSRRSTWAARLQFTKRSLNALDIQAAEVAMAAPPRMAEEVAMVVLVVPAVTLGVALRENLAAAL